MASTPLSVDWTQLGPQEHIVYFYDEEKALIDAIVDYLSAGFQARERGLVVATHAHLREVELRMADRGISLQTARQRGDYIPLNAAETLSRFMIGGMPDRSRFMAAVGSVAQAARSARHALRAYGEMVAILWSEGNVAGAIELESLWNELIAQQSFRLLCAYPMARFRRGSSQVPFEQVCSHHTRCLHSAA